MLRLQPSPAGIAAPTTQWPARRHRRPVREAGHSPYRRPRRCSLPATPFESSGLFGQGRFRPVAVDADCKRDRVIPVAALHVSRPLQALLAILAMVAAVPPAMSPGVCGAAAGPEVVSSNDVKLDSCCSGLKPSNRSTPTSQHRPRTPRNQTADARLCVGQCAAMPRRSTAGSRQAHRPPASALSLAPLGRRRRCSTPRPDRFILRESSCEDGVSLRRSAAVDVCLR